MMNSKHNNNNSNNKDPQCNIEQHAVVLAQWSRIGYLFPFIKGIVYPLFKVSLVALASELLREVLRISLDGELFEQIEDKLYGTVRDSTVTSIYLMEGLSFYQSFGVVCVYIVIISIVQPIHGGLMENFNCYMEVKRLQMILYDKFMLEPNSVEIKEARELVYKNMNSIEKYWNTAKYWMVDDCTSTVWSLLLIFILAWDLGFMISGATAIIFLGTKSMWNKLSTPRAVQRETKMSASSARLMDLVTCKDVVLSHTMEVDERESLYQAVYSDKAEIQHLFWAKTISLFIQYITFTFVMPLLFVFVNEVDLTLERVFQLLLLIVIQDEMVRAYLSLSNHGPVVEEFQRAKKTFARVLGVDEEELFPPDFALPTFCTEACTKNNGGDGARTIEGKLKPLYAKQRSTLTKALGGLLEFDLEKGRTPQAPSDDYRRSLLQSGQSCKQLEIYDLSLGYWRRNGSLNLVVERLNLTLNVGEHYALMGETGAGKSTLFKGIAGLIPMLKGGLSVGEIKVDTTSRPWRKQLGVVSQDTVLFNRTLRENLAYGLTRITDAEIYCALDKVNLKTVVDALPQGLDTEVRYNGNEFSGGQQQRMQITRLLLRDSPVVLLDEMTSALDPETTKDVLDVLKEFLEGKTVIMVTHDTQTLTLANHILRMQIGKPIEIKEVIAKDLRTSSRCIESNVST